MHVATKKAPLRRGFLLRVDHQIGRPIRSLSVGALFGASSAREHQHDDEAGGDNCGLQIQRQREVGGGTEELEKRAHPTIRSLQGYAGSQAGRSGSSSALTRPAPEPAQAFFPAFGLSTKSR